jgi:response regulator RpfG family c-di-GMP phosphodiesterase
MSHCVLLIENDDSYGDSLRQLLEGEGVRVLHLNEGNHAMDIVIEERPALILLAVELPTVSGFRVCKTIKRNPEVRDIPLFLMSTPANEEACNQHRTLKVSAQEYFIKPFSAESLVGRALAYLGGDVSGDSVEESGGETEEEMAVDLDVEVDLIEEVTAAEEVVEESAPDGGESSESAEVPEPPDAPGPPPSPPPVSNAAVHSQLVQQLRSRVAEGEEAYRRLRGEHDGTLDQLLALQEQLGKLQHESLEFRQTVARQSLDMERLRSQCGELEGSVREAWTKTEEVEERLGASETARHGAQSLLSAAQAERDQAATTLGAVTQEHEVLRGVKNQLDVLLDERGVENSRLEEELAGQGETLNSAQEQLDAEKSAAEQVRAENLNMAEEQRRMAERFSELEVRTQELDRQATSAHEQASQLEAERDSLTSQLEMLEGAASELRSACEEASAARDSLQGQLADVARVRDELQEQMTGVGGERDSARAELGEHQTALVQAVEESDALKREIADFDARLAELNSDLSSTQQALSAAKAERSGVEENLHRAQADLQEAKEEIARAQEESSSATNAAITRQSVLSAALIGLNEAQTATKANLDAATGYGAALEHRLAHAAEAFQRMGTLLEAGLETLQATGVITTLPEVPDYVDISALNLADDAEASELIAEELGDSLLADDPAGSVVSLAEVGEALAGADGDGDGEEFIDIVSDESDLSMLDLGLDGVEVDIEEVEESADEGDS